MAYSYARRNELAEQRLYMLGVIRDPNVQAYSQERRMGLGNAEGRAAYVRENDWFYRGTVGTTSDRRAPIDTPTTAKNYVKGFLYKGRETPSRKEARNRFVDTTGGVDWNLWRDERLGYKRGTLGTASVPLVDDPDHEEYFEEEMYEEGNEPDY